MSQVRVLTKRNRYWTDTFRCSEVSLKTAYEGFRFVAEAAIGETWGRLGLGLGSVRRGAMREKRKNEKTIFEAKDLVILNPGLLLWIQNCYNVLVKGKVWMRMGVNSETDGARPPPSMEPEQYKKIYIQDSAPVLKVEDQGKKHIRHVFAVIFNPRNTWLIIRFLLNQYSSFLPPEQETIWYDEVQLLITQSLYVWLFRRTRCVEFWVWLLATFTKNKSTSQVGEGHKGPFE